MTSVNGRPAILLIEPNLAFARPLTEALRQHGFEVHYCAHAEHALTIVEWNMPAAIICAAKLQKPSDNEVPSILASDPRTSHIPVLAMGDGHAQALINAYLAGYDDYIDCRLGVENVACRVVALLSNWRGCFQPAQVPPEAETSLKGRLSAINLPSVLQMVAQAGLTGALHISTESTDGTIYFMAGEISHAETGQLIGMEAAAYMLKNCSFVENGDYKFVSGSSMSQCTVQCSVTEIILEAMRELDEGNRNLTEARK
jgi:CheY-like chemotaxis protein